MWRRLERPAKYDVKTTLRVKRDRVKKNIVVVATPNPPAAVDAGPANVAPTDRITATCPNCNAKLAVGVEKSGMRLLCPKCQAAIQVPHERADDPPETTPTLRLWNVAVAGKKSGPLGNAELQAVALLYQSELESSPSVRVTHKLLQRFGIPLRTSHDVLAKLEAAGLVVVTKPPGRCRVVEILPGPLTH